MADKSRAPLYEALVAHDRLRATAFHVPGHKQRSAWHDGEGTTAYYGNLLALDVTELADTDDLHHPEGPLLEAQELAADCFGAEETRFLIGGSTSGNLAMILGICRPGELVIAQRNVHKSIIHGLMMGGVRAVLLPPDIDRPSGLAVAPSPQLIQEALKRYPQAKAVIVSSPNYYGMSPDLKSIVDTVHVYGVPVLVDEAHGAHFGFHPRFPGSALQAGADLVVQSTHKMLSAMTMGAMLHMQGERLPRPAIRHALAMIQSSSPSFPIMASLDLARRQLHMQGELAFQSALEGLAEATVGLELTPFRALGYGNCASDGIDYDPLKLSLFDESGAMSGFALRDALAERGCVAEMADARYSVMAFGTGSVAEDGKRLREALADISLRLKLSEKSERPQPNGEIAMLGTQDSVPEPVQFGREQHESTPIPLEECAGRVSAEWVIPYPPGIPILFPGETITESTVEQLQRWRHKGAQIQGAKDSQLRTIQVRTEE
ncbi:aminotransferase class I/II-fold pyridoxal phosphate-dependent enzyme [Cohnella terricola]|uniref:Aminotransferase class I/II-fold pyridoxal phosphate-dependent enzyme n=1 Tax=Cohnella terricola TaxID=1289167 RepID=A0A559J788_9BACL|nr:aminotransferase class I/II-fold pyridoxal phosphate-dependent enzyme [Cohnella terricola]TVX95765.1 aminotransferase class I/II-fold pyridoxal phosphate-dependent enzyme [Cohnella terricola]